MDCVGTRLPHRQFGPCHSLKDVTLGLLLQADPLSLLGIPLLSTKPSTSHRLGVFERPEGDCSRKLRQPDTTIRPSCNEENTALPFATVEAKVILRYKFLLTSSLLRRKSQDD